MEKLNPINEIITKQVANENYEFVFVKDGNFIVTDRKVLVIQPLKYYSIPEDQVNYLNGKCFSKESFREIQKADKVQFMENGVYCEAKSGTVRKLIFYYEKECKIDLSTYYELLENVEPCDGTGIKTDYFVKLSKCLLDYQSDHIEFYQVINTNLKLIKDDRYDEQITLLVA